MLRPLEVTPGGEPPAADGRRPAPELVRLAPPREKKSFVRAPPDRTQRWRRAFQVAFLLLNVAIGVQFWTFVRFFESGGAGVHPPRPPGIEGWLPIAALMNLKAALLTGELPRRFPAGMVLLVAFLAITFLFRKAFCSWLCPVGTLSEALWKLGRRLFRRTFALPRWADLPLRTLKYLLLAFFLWAVAGMSVAAIGAFLESPYGLVADVKMLDFFRHLGTAAAVVIAGLAAASVFVQNFWCRYLCPYGALHGLVSWPSPVRIRRDPATCIDCAKCAKACPSLLAVDVKRSIASPECTGCLECVAVCPVKDALAMSVARRGRLSAGALAAGIAVVFLGLAGLARLTGHWHTEVDPRVYSELIPRAGELGHPR
ncbi:MAG TPA: 4Fe-4S binding protein [Anaeromyxobacteraceae bacterium]|nr:4Fe-4S binding protein [Anaeromyxobacteraceae bacterium]